MRHRDIGYGMFPGGDPRKFTPDPECATEAEIAAWREDCVRAAVGEEMPDRAPTHTCLMGHATSYGLGSYEIEYDCEGDPECPECHPYGSLQAKGLADE